MKPFRVILCDMNKEITQLWRDFIQETAIKNPNVVFISNDIFERLIQKLGQKKSNDPLKVLAVVSPGNSFGYLGGGFDRALYDYFGGSPFEKWFRKQLDNEYKPVGSITTVDLKNCKIEGLNLMRDGIRYLIHCPTMITPNDPIYNPLQPIKSGVEPVFNATWNALRYTPDGIDALIISGLCTGFAGVPVNLSCKSMIFAIRLYLCDGLISTELKNVLIMYFLGYPYESFIPDACKIECEKVGINLRNLQKFNALTDSIDSILPPHLIIR